MAMRAPFQSSDLLGFSRRTLGAFAGLIGLVEAMHGRAAGEPGPSGARGKAYGKLRRVTGLVSGGIDALLGRFGAASGELPSSPEREAVLAALNGVLGDYLEASGNPQAIPMRLRRAGLPLGLERPALAAAIPHPGSRLLVLVHGLFMNDLQWTRQGHDHGAALERDLGRTALYLHYNSGRHISTNGREFAELLERLVGAWPVPVAELEILGFSMGGLLARSAWHYGTAAGHGWPARLGKLVFLATPHFGAPLERAGHWVDLLLGASSYTEPLARLGQARSAGITDLRHSSLLDEDWVGRDRFADSADLPRALPLPEGVACYAMAATTGRREGDFKDRWIADGLVPLASALGRHEDPARTLRFPEARQWIGYRMNHLDLLCRPEVYGKLRQWIGED
jgi:hypothetical protein